MSTLSNDIGIHFSISLGLHNFEYFLFIKNQLFEYWIKYYSFLISCGSESSEVCEPPFYIFELIAYFIKNL